MPIPLLNKNGFLPEGLHDATLEELRVQFGAFQESDRRTKLFAKLTELIQAMTASNLFEELLIDGSFVTGKSVPNDIDLLAVLKPGHDFEGNLSMFEYSLVSRTLLRRRFGFDVVVAERASNVYKT